MENGVFRSLLLITLIALTGCASTYKVAMSPVGDIDNDFKNVTKGKIHLYPVAQSPAIVQYKAGLISLSQRWTPDSTAEPDYITDANIPSVILERSKQALQEAGYTLSYGPEAPVDAVLTLKEEVLGVFENPTSPLIANMVTAFAFGFVGTSSHPVGEVYVSVTYKDAKDAGKTVVVKGKGRSSAHLTKQSGFDRSMNFALSDFQQNLVKATRNELP